MASFASNSIWSICNQNVKILKKRLQWKPLNVINDTKVPNPSCTVVNILKVSYCYHLVNEISFNLSQSDHIKRLTQTISKEANFRIIYDVSIYHLFLINFKRMVVILNYLFDVIDKKILESFTIGNLNQIKPNLT
jgi:hypothetical protein